VSALPRAWAANEEKALDLATPTSSCFGGKTLVWDDSGGCKGEARGTNDATEIAIAARHSLRKVLRSDAALAVLPPRGSTTERAG
jgi:hypothetical protein